MNATITHRGWIITPAVIGYDIQHPDYDRENEIDWRHGHADTVEGARIEIDRLLAEDAEWTEAASILKIGAETKSAPDGLPVNHEVNNGQGFDFNHAGGAQQGVGAASGRTGRVEGCGPSGTGGGKILGVPFRVNPGDGRSICRPVASPILPPEQAGAVPAGVMPMLSVMHPDTPVAIARCDIRRGQTVTADMLKNAPSSAAPTPPDAGIGSDGACPTCGDTSPLPECPDCGGYPHRATQPGDGGRS